MRFIADFHIHSYLSRACSKTLHPEVLYKWCQLKGIGVLVTGDFVHPKWLAELKEKLKTFAVRLVLTAHPTQFYPGAVLGIINDLANALAENNAVQINMYLQQLGKTPFFKNKNPRPMMRR